MVELSPEGMLTGGKTGEENGDTGHTEGRWAFDNQGRGWSDVSTSQGMLKVARCRQKLEEVGSVLPNSLLREHNPADPLT